MATSTNQGAGIVKFVAGEAKATAIDGTTRVLQIGDRIFAKEIISTSANAVVQVHLESGRLFDLRPDSTLTLDDDVLGAGGTVAPPAAVQQQDIIELQTVIGAGVDPTRVTEAAAAGSEAPSSTGEEKSAGDHAFVMVEQANSTGEVTAGFTTQSAVLESSAPGPGVVAIQDEVPLLAQEGLPLFVRDPSPVVSVPVQAQAAADTSHEPQATSQETVATTDTLAPGDLLQGEQNANDLTAYLSLTYDANSNATTVNVTTSGSGAADHKIVLTGVDLTAGGTLTTDTIIQNLLASGKLHTDV